MSISLHHQYTSSPYGHHPPLGPNSTSNLNIGPPPPPPPQQQSQQQETPARSLFVCRLPFNTSAEEVSSAFRTIGELTKENPVRLIMLDLIYIKL